MPIYKSDEKQLSSNASALAQLIMGAKQKQDQMGLDADLQQGSIAANQAAADALATKQGLKPGKYSTSVSATGYGVSPQDPLRGLLMPLTPAQEAAEKAVGKQIADFDSAGGRPAMEKNLGALGEVEKELVDGERDAWDRGVGSMLSGFPGLMGVFGSTEKGRRDKARSTALTIAKATDPNPTEKQIEAIMGQIYDPASSDEDNLSRIQRFQEEQRQKAKQMEQASQNYKRTGYATIGNPQAQQAASQAPQTQSKVVNGVTYVKVPGGWKKAQ